VGYTKTFKRAENRGVTVVEGGPRGKENPNNRGSQKRKDKGPRELQSKKGEGGDEKGTRRTE